jgi:arylformamidase
VPARNIPIYAGRPDEFFMEHFMPGLAVGDPTVWIERARALGRAAEGRLTGARFDLRYGPAPLQTLDVFPAANPDAPIALCIRGGY